jgi:hypothetical protein
MAKQIAIEDVTLRCQVSTRGGGIEIDLTRFGFKGEKMSAYQNYLGGGMLGKVSVNNTIQAYNKPCTEKQVAKLERIGERLKKHYHSLTNPEDSEWESQSYLQNQNMPVSGF